MANTSFILPKYRRKAVTAFDVDGLGLVIETRFRCVPTYTEMLRHPGLKSKYCTVPKLEERLEDR